MSGRLPLADAAELAPLARRTRALRLGAAALLAVLAVVAVAVASRGRGGDPAVRVPGRTTVVVLDVSSSVQPLVFRQIHDTLAQAVRDGGDVGLVAFSDVAYELLPPGTPARELEGVRRLFVPVRAGDRRRQVALEGRRYPLAPWTETLTSGTRISAGLRLARAVLARDRVADPALTLVSDLEDEYHDLPALGRELGALAEDGVPLKVVALSPQPSDLTLFRRLLRERGTVEAARRPERLAGPASLPDEPFPLALAAALVALAAALAANERLGARLPLRRGEGEA